jgi:hypothetical protein
MCVKVISFTIAIWRLIVVDEQVMAAGVQSTVIELDSVDIYGWTIAGCHSFRQRKATFDEKGSELTATDWVQRPKLLKWDRSAVAVQMKPWILTGSPPIPSSIPFSH